MSKLSEFTFNILVSDISEYKKPNNWSVLKRVLNLSLNSKFAYIFLKNRVDFNFLSSYGSRSKYVKKMKFLAIGIMLLLSIFALTAEATPKNFLFPPGFDQNVDGNQKAVPLSPTWTPIP